MIDVPSAHLQIILDILKTHVPDCEVRAFGSRYTWTAKDHSDLDLAVVGTEKLSHKTLAALQESFAESDLPYRVDVLDWRAISPEFQKVIEQGYEVIQDPKGFKRPLGFAPRLAMGSKPGDDINFNLPAHWRWQQLDDLKAKDRRPIISGPFGSNIGSRFFTEEGIPVIRGNNLSLSLERFIDDGYVFISEEKANELNTWAEQDDILFTAAGTIGQVGIIGDKTKFKKYIISNKQIRVRLNKDEVNPLFVYYWLAGPLLIEYIQQRNTGSTIPLINLSVVKSLPVPVPPLSEQNRIVSILSALDDKIELNRQTNATLEAIAQAIFKEWFVDNAETEDSDVAPFPEIIDVNPPRTLKKGEIAPYLDMANMPTQGHRAIEWIDRPFGSGTKFINGDTLLARITPCLENGKTAFVDFLSEGQTGWGSTEFIILRPKQPLPPEYGYFVARSESARNHAIQNMIGTSGRQRTPSSAFDSFMMRVPPMELASQFGDIAGSLMTQIKANDEESRTLTRLRDNLLPKLMSGEINV